MIFGYRVKGAGGRGQGKFWIMNYGLWIVFRIKIHDSRLKNQDSAILPPYTNNWFIVSAPLDQQTLY